jgi:WhiB family redox-sensing transcriptional regulator
MWIEDWTPSAACRQAQPDELFVRGAEQNKAKQLCTGCPVRTECLAEALDNQIEWGVWGGMTERERRALLRRAVDENLRELMLLLGVGMVSDRPFEVREELLELDAVRCQVLEFREHLGRLNLLASTRIGQLLIDDVVGMGP